MASSSPEPFTIHASDEQLQDLRKRLETARIVPDEIEDAGLDPNGAWAYGSDKKTVEAFVEHWLHSYDWRKHEARLNSFKHFTMPVRGLRTHFIHERSEKPGAVPLLLLHGWPGSIVEFLKVLEPLKAAGFHCVAPSLLGYGWSEAPKKRGGDVAFMADHMHRLMLQLGYERYVAQGGDWGAIISTIIASRYPQNCVALHVNMCVTPLPSPSRDWYGFLKVAMGLPFLSAEERKGLASTQYFQKYETAYQQIQGTKPQSLAYGLNDSPVGLLAWILEKFQSWADCNGGGPEQSGLTKDEILTDVMVYWLTQSVGSSLRIYYETLGHNPHAKGMSGWGYVAVPTGVLVANNELFKPPRLLADLYFNVKHWSVQERGGHFFAFEQPERYVADVCRFFKEVVSFNACKANAPRPGQGRPAELGKYAIMASLGAGIAGIVSKGLRARL